MNRLNLNIKNAIRFLVSSVFLLFFLSISMLSCTSTRKVIKEPIKEEGADYVFAKLKENELKFEFFSAKFSLDLVIDKKKTSFRGQLRMRKDSAIWISISPALGIEMARILITNDSIMFINRLNKTYFTGNYRVVSDFLDTNLDYDVLQSILLGNDLTYYENGKFRVNYDSKEYHLVTAGRSKLKKYVKTRQDAERVFIQNIYLSPETFKITKMKIKEFRKETKKLDAFYSDFQKLGDQLFPKHLMFNINADSPVEADVFYSKIKLDLPLNFPFKISSKYERIR